MVEEVAQGGNRNWSQVGSRRETETEEEDERAGTGHGTGRRAVRGRRCKGRENKGCRGVVRVRRTGRGGGLGKSRGGNHTCEYKQYCHVGNTAKQCRLGLLQDSDVAGDLED